ncbi:pyridoxal phosphate-dependent transferase [Cladorrhinum sp. PSN259]|nr:pyridoxal phosphate-dependent transferase [Cladorrhinum sp. PSN259]
MEAPEKLSLGDPLPKGDHHAVSVYLPTWRDNIRWAEREPDILQVMNTGYPRFFIPRVVTKLSQELLSLVSTPAADGTGALAFASIAYANWFAKYMRKDAVPFDSRFQLHLVQWYGGTTRLRPDLSREDAAKLTPSGEDYLFIVSFPTDLTDKARKLIQHSGYAISTRRAMYWLECAPLLHKTGSSPSTALTPQSPPRRPNLCSWTPPELPQQKRPPSKHCKPYPYREEVSPSLNCALCQQNKAFIELPRNQEGYLNDVKTAERALRWRIAASADCYCHRAPTPNADGDCSNSDSSREDKHNAEVRTVDPDKDVFLYPTGMTAIAAAIQAVVNGVQNPIVAVFGFLYVDTIKLLQLVIGENHVTIVRYDELDLFEKQLRSGTKYCAVFTEFPSNPLLRSPDLLRLREMSLTYDFKLVVDDTIGTSAALSLLDHCDAICTSMTKMFSGGCNVMGGSVVINPRRSPDRSDYIREKLKTITDKNAYFGQDMIVMERNSRDFADRVFKASNNAEAMLEVFRKNPAVRTVYYPKGSDTQVYYEQYKKKGAGYGFLMSIEFGTDVQAVTFHDAFDVAKGPSLGTNFTLCCPYTILAHYKELDWAASHGVIKNLVRISFGVEKRDWVRQRVVDALDAAR